MNRFLSIGCFLALWEFTGRAEFIQPPEFFPPLTQVFEAILRMAKKGVLAEDLVISLSRASAGFVIGSCVAVVTGMVTGRSAWWNKSLTPLIQFLRPLPPVAMLPLVIVWFGIGEESKVLLIAYAVFFPVWINTHIGAQEIAKTFLWSANSLNVKGIGLIWKVIFPGALPYILAGFRTGVALAFIMVFVAEQGGASEGVGFRIWTSILDYRIDQMIGALLLLGVMGAAADLLLVKSMTGMFPWLKFVKQK